MKKKIIAVLMAVMVVAALLVGCGGNGKTLEDLVNTPEMQQQILEANANAGSTGMIMDIETEGDTLVYIFKYTSPITDTMRTTMEDTLRTMCNSESNKATYKAVVDAIKKEATAVKNPAVVLRYLDQNGVEIYSHTYN